MYVNLFEHLETIAQLIVEIKNRGISGTLKGLLSIKLDHNLGYPANHLVKIVVKTGK